MKFKVSTNVICYELKNLLKVPCTHNNITITAEDSYFLLTRHTSFGEIICRERANVEVAGEIELDGKLFETLLSELKDSDNILFESNETDLTVQCRNTKFSIACTVNNTLTKYAPMSPDITYYKTCGHDLKFLINKVLFCIDDENSKYALKGGYMEVKSNNLIMIGCDGYKLALRSMELLNREDIDSNFIVPKKALESLLKLLSNVHGFIHFYADENYCYFYMHEGDMFLKTCLIKEKYLDYQQVIPLNTYFKFHLETKELLSAVKSCLKVSSNSPTKVKNAEGKTVSVFPTPIIFDIGGKEDFMRVSRKGIKATFEKSIEAQKLNNTFNENDLTIGFDTGHLLDILKHVEHEIITVEFSQPLQPILICPKEQIDFKSMNYVLLPVKFKID